MASSEAERGGLNSLSCLENATHRGSFVIMQSSPRLVKFPASMAIAMPSPSFPSQTPTYEASAYTPVMTDEQLETLRRQIFVYATICSQLVNLHRATVGTIAQEPLTQGLTPSQLETLDPDLGSQGLWMTTRHRWTPSHAQLQILEDLFDKGLVSPSKQKIKDMTLELIRHGPISETNIYNWFQNRKARAKRKQQSASQRGIERDVEVTEEVKKKRRIRENSVLEDSLVTPQMSQKKQTGIEHSTLLDCGGGSISQVSQCVSRSDSFNNLDPQDGYYLLDTMDAIVDANIWESPTNVDMNCGESVFLNSELCSVFLTEGNIGNDIVSQCEHHAKVPY